MNQEVKDIKAIFSEALEKQTNEERSAYLGRVCGNDAGLRDRIEKLLKAHNEAGCFLEPPVLDAEVALDLPLTEKPDIGFVNQSGRLECLAGQLL